MRWIVLCVLLLLANIEGLAAELGGAAGQPLPAGWPRNSTADLGDGLTWRLAAVPDLTTADSVWLISELYNAGEHPVRVEWKLADARPRFVLTPKGKDPISRPLRKDTPTQKLVYAATAGPQKSVFSVRVDLRSSPCRRAKASVPA